jgi:hypothetical protein
LEQHGIPVRALAYEEGRLFTRIYSRAVPIKDMEDAEELKLAMDELIRQREYVTVRKGIVLAIEDLR